MRWRSIVLPVVGFLFLFMIIFVLEYPTARSPETPRTKPSGAAAGKSRTTRPPSPRTKIPPRSPAKSAGPPMAALIIDDLGYNLEVIETLHAIGRPLTVAILPYAPLTEESARRAAARGLEIMLHLPLESMEDRNGFKPLEGTIFKSFSADDVRTGVEKCLARIPGVRGVNNHAGSLATESPEVMRPIFEVLKSRGLYFVDSRTTNASVAFEEAERMGVPAAARQVFLDAESDEETIPARLRELFLAAQKHGRAVGIGHPKQPTLAALAGNIRLADAYGVRLVFASEIVR